MKTNPESPVTDTESADALAAAPQQVRDIIERMTELQAGSQLGPQQAIVVVYVDAERSYLQTSPCGDSGLILGSALQGLANTMRVENTGGSFVAEILDRIGTETAVRWATARAAADAETAEDGR